MRRATSPRLLRRVVATVAALVGAVVPATTAGASGTPAAPVFTGPGSSSATGPTGVAHPVAVGGAYQPLAMACGDERRVLWYSPGAGADFLWRNVSMPVGGAASHSASVVGVGGDYLPLTGDFDGDGCEDVLWVTRSSGTASRLWYFAPDGTYRSTGVQPGAPAGMTPLVGSFNGDGADDVFWYGAGAARERIWNGTSRRGSFTEATAPQVVGNYTPVSALDRSSILWYRPGAGTDYLWRGVTSGAPAPYVSSPTSVNGLYLARNLGGTALLFTPGTGEDHLVTGVSAPSASGAVSLGTVSAALDETYTIGDSTARAGFGVLHLPKEGQDYLVAPRAAPAPGAVPWGWQSAMLASVNAERAAAGRAPLTLCSSLSRAAQDHTDDQARMAAMSHTGSDGSSLSVRVERAGYRQWSTLGENVAFWYRSVGEVMASWMRSPSHRDNLLSTAFTHIGLGRTQRSADGTWFWTQDFGRSGTC